MIKKPMQPTPATEICPLCSDNNISFYHSDSHREYFQCGKCSLVFVPELYHLGPEEEKERYDLHQNNAEDEGYRRFLSRLSQPLIERLPPAQSGLDFGCGPGPVLAMMLEEAGHRISLYDLYYHDEPEILKRSYDFITATEVAEHLSSPGPVLSRLIDMLNSGGYLGLMTKLVTGPDAFSRWHYIQDDTHISFFSKKTFEYLSARHNTALEFIGNDVIILKKM